MKATRAYIASLGTTGVLVTGSILLLVVVSALVAFRGWPGGGIAEGLDDMLGDRGEPTLQVSGPAQIAADAAPAAAAVAATAPAGTAPAGSGGTTIVGRGPAFRSPGPVGPAPGGTGAPRATPSAGSAPANGGGTNNVGPVARQLADSTDDTTRQLGQTVGDVSPQLGNQVTDTGKAVTDIVRGLGTEPVQLP